MPTKLTDNVVLDAACDKTRLDVTHIVLCDGVPADFSDANTLKSGGGHRICRVAITEANFTGPADGDVSGRKITFNQLANQAMEEAGLGDHIALLDDVNSVLLHLHPESEERGGTAQAGAASTITLDAGASANDDHYNGMRIEITGGTGSGQTRDISDYVGSTKVATVSSNWTTNPDNTSVFTIFGKTFTASDQVTFEAFDIEFEDPS